MPKNKDTRDFTFSRGTDAKFKLESVADKASGRLPGDHRIEVGQINNFTGSPQNVRSINTLENIDSFFEQSPSNAQLIDEALKRVKSISGAFGFASEEKAEFIPDSFVKETSAGTRIVNLQQQYRGIPVYLMERTVVFNKDGTINYPGDNVSLSSDIDIDPVVLLETAAKAAAEYMTFPSDEKDPWTGELIPEIEIDLTGYEPEVLGRVSLAARPAILSKGPFAENIPAHLVVFYQGETTRLGWHFIISTPNFEEQFVIIVEADAQTEDIDKPEVLYARRISSRMATKGKVWVHNPKMNQGGRELVDFPLELAKYPIDSGSLTLPNGFPPDWVEAGTLMTIGNCTVAVTGNTTNSASGTNNNGLLTFDPGDANAQGDIQKVINIFYFCNYMHDFFYMLGFDEKHGNFQKINFTGLGTGNDPVLARAHPGAVIGTANMATRADGTRPIMNMGLVTGTNRHTAFDSDVVFHEFTHGVTNRLVGRRLDFHSLEEPQSAAMGEAWSDYFALTIQNCLALINDPTATEKNVTGDWISNRGGGIRLAPYDDNYPATYGDLGSPPYDEDEHSIGEIWCAALMKMNRDFGTTLGNRVRGHQIGWQIVVDALKQTSANPSFLQARDAMLKALDDLIDSGQLADAGHTTLKVTMWKAFARFGMGPGAFSNGPALEGIIEDRNSPTNI